MIFLRNHDELTLEMVTDEERKLMRREYAPDPQALVVSLDYAAAMTRYHYRRVPQALPRTGDWAGLAAYYKRYYNTPAGKGSEVKFLEDCERCGVS